jgi:hypothetical protein
VPRPSSPLDAKASVRSPYALDRSQQNSCVGTESARRPYEGPVSIPHMRFDLSLPDNDVFIRSVLKPRGTGRTNPSIHDVIEPPARPVRSWRRKRVAFRDRYGRFEGWWSQTGSNRRPHACKARALPTELWPPWECVVIDLVRPPEVSHKVKCGGPRQTRTADLTLIRRVL